MQGKMHFLRKLYCAVPRSLQSVAAISSEQWGTTWRTRSPQRSQRGEAPEAERKLNFDNTITPLIHHLSKHFGVSQKSV